MSFLSSLFRKKSTQSMVHVPTTDEQLAVNTSVKIVNYGHKVTMSRVDWAALLKIKKVRDTQPENILHADKDGWEYDTLTEVVGTIGKVRRISTLYGETVYELIGIGGIEEEMIKRAWFYRDQLQPI